MAAIVGITCGLALQTTCCAVPLPPGMNYDLNISPDFSNYETAEIAIAALGWESSTGVKFHLTYVRDCNYRDSDYKICIFKSPTAFLPDNEVGVTSTNPQQSSFIFLNEIGDKVDGSQYLTLALHEIGHALGLNHTIHGVMHWKLTEIYYPTPGDIDQFYDVRGWNEHTPAGDPIYDEEHPH